MGGVRMCNWIELATIASPIISAIAIVVALIIAKSSTKDAQRQITEVHSLLDVFVSSQNVHIVEEKKKLEEEMNEMMVRIAEQEEALQVIRHPFAFTNSDTAIMDAQEKQNMRSEIMMMKREYNALDHRLSIINDYLEKAEKIQGKGGGK